MLKKIVLALTVALATASVHGKHADSKTTSIFYGRFELKVPTHQLAGAKILSVDGPVIKFSDSVILAGTIATHETLGLPEDFELARYPRYIFGLETTDSLSGELKQVLEGALGSFGIGAGAETAAIEHERGVVYSACLFPSCLIFATRAAEPEQLLMLFPEGFSRDEILGFMGVSDVERISSEKRLTPTGESIVNNSLLSSLLDSRATTRRCFHSLRGATPHTSPKRQRTGSGGPATGHSRAELISTALYNPYILLARNERRQHADIPWSQAAGAADTGFPYRIRLSWCTGATAGPAF